MNREIDWGRFILAFLIACFLFSFGLFIGYLTKGVVESTTIDIIASTRNELTNLETLTVLEKDYPCNSFVLDETSDKLNYLGELITTLEVKKGKNNNEVLELKKMYTLLEARHMILIKQKNTQCNQNYSTFLFFYSNEKECQTKEGDISFILSYLRKKYDFVRVYSFDVNLDSEIIKFLKDAYKIEGCESVVLNDKKIEGKIENSDDFEVLLNKNTG